MTGRYVFLWPLLVKTLPPRMQFVLLQRSYGLTYRQVGYMIGRSRERVRQIQDKGTRLLTAKWRRRAVFSYLRTGEHLPVASQRQRPSPPCV